MDSAPGKIELEYTNRIALEPGIIKGMRTYCAAPLVPRQSAIGSEIGGPVALAGGDLRSAARPRQPQAGS
jgi:hypothetical protein